MPLVPLLPMLSNVGVDVDVVHICYMRHRHQHQLPPQGRGSGTSGINVNVDAPCSRINWLFTIYILFTAGCRHTPDINNINHWFILLPFYAASRIRISIIILLIINWSSWGTVSCRVVRYCNSWRYVLPISLEDRAWTSWPLTWVSSLTLANPLLLSSSSFPRRHLAIAVNIKLTHFVR